MIATPTGPVQDPSRRELVLGSGLNGIDYVELDDAAAPVLRVYFLRPLPPGAYGLPHMVDRIRITGGRRIPTLRATAAARARGGPGSEEAFLRITLDRRGDFSEYTLYIELPELDLWCRSATFRFTANQPIDVDCEVPPSAPRALGEPLIDYMAKDFSSFRQAMLEVLPQLNPSYVERSPADLGITLIELLAYAGDQLSYLQDAVANEAYLDTLRLRVSARRHARLLDYHMHDGRNSWTWVQVAVDAEGDLPEGTPLLTQVSSALTLKGDLPAAVIDDRGPTPVITAKNLAYQPALAAAVVFETTHPQHLDPMLNQIYVHDWGVPGALLAAGTRTAYLFAVTAGTAVRPSLHDGDFITLEQLRSVATGLEADADPQLRQVVTLEGEPLPIEDEVFAADVSSGILRRRHRDEPALPLLQVTWGAADALRFDLPLSVPEGSPIVGGAPSSPFATARGNIVLADQGLTTVETLTSATTLTFGPLTMAAPPTRYNLDAVTNQVAPEPRRDVSADVHAVMPAVVAVVSGELWTPAPDLLESLPFDRRFVAEVDDDGFATLRFGDGEYGRELDPIALASGITVTHRVGNGTLGNIGAEGISHLVVNDRNPGAAWLLQSPPRLRNPLAATGGVEPETIDEVRSRAPQAALVQARAVTEEDYRSAALSVPGVAQAAANMEWTGSWHTAFVGVEPSDPVQLVTAPDGSLSLAPRLATAVAGVLEAERLAGCDLEIGAPHYVPLEIELRVVVAADHFQTDVVQAVADVLSSRILPDGTVGFFHHSRLAFGQPVFLSQVLEAASSVPGVESVTPVVFHPVGAADSGQLDGGVISISTFEIARLDGDPRNPDNGVLRLTSEGGK
ncbi:MAG TPA: baseplate J/gp47 family protein [Candidatus Dormibacteraeota bacterium]|nr:baseplate J/gp47 family protein [Candidatus Dormibacteraeota bacterium]